MVVDRKLSLRPANPADRNAILTMTRFDERVHVHLDWKPVEDWLGAQPFLVAERGRRVLGSLACPPDPPHTAWLRLFTQVDEVPAAEMWALLWGRAEALLRERGVRNMAALTMDAWMEGLCAESGFQRTHAVMVLSRGLQPVSARPARAGLTVRPARQDDYKAIIGADTAAFSTPWQMSGELLLLALERADYLTVAECDGAVVAYQLSTRSHRQAAHLARLAVLPAHQGQGLGAALLTDLLDHYQRRGAHEITVNTQDTNAASLALYQRLGFVPTGTRFPVYQYDLTRPVA